MPHSPGLMESHISLKETNTGDLQMEKKTQITQSLSAKGLMVFQMILMQPLSGQEMGRSTFLKELSTGGLIQTSDRQ